MRIAVRVDASPALGAGHLARCMTLATALRRDGAAVLLICRADASPLTAALRTGNVPVHWLTAEQTADPSADARATCAALTEPCDWLIVDHYGLDAAWEQVLRARARRILVIDDHAARRHDCDLLLNPNLPVTAADYRGRVPETCRLLLGPQYALLRDEFHRQRATVRAREGTVRRLLISCGGSDPGNATAQALAALAILAQAGALSEIAVEVIAGPGHRHWRALRAQTHALPGARFRRATRQMAAAMAAADVAIGAGGGSLWERCFLGLPALVITVADNQRAATAALAARGACWDLGPVHGLAPAKVAAHLAALLRDPAAVRAASQAALAVVGSASFSRHPLRWLAGDAAEQTL